CETALGRLRRLAETGRRPSWQPVCPRLRNLRHSPSEVLPRPIERRAKLFRTRRETRSGTMQKIRIDHEQIAPGDCGELAPLIPFVEPCRPDRIVGADDDRFGSRCKQIYDADGWSRRGERCADV